MRRCPDGRCRYPAASSKDSAGGLDYPCGQHGLLGPRLGAGAEYGVADRTAAEALAEHKAASERTGPDDPASSGRARSRDYVRHDIVDAVVAQATRLAERRGLQPLPLGLTPHKLRHAFASILVAIGGIRPT